MRILLLGGGGFATEVGELVEATGNEIAGVLDEGCDYSHHPVLGLPIVRELPPSGFDALAVAVGDTKTRRKFWERFSPDHRFPLLVHPSAIVSGRSEIGEGCLVMQNVVVNGGARVAENVILNVDCCVAHDCRVGAHSHIAPAVQMAGGSSAGEGVFCGSGTLLLPRISVGAWTTCGAGSVVTKDLPGSAVAWGSPARVHRSSPS